GRQQTRDRLLHGANWVVARGRRHDRNPFSPASVGPPVVNVGGRVAKQVVAVRLAIAPLTDGGVHVRGLRVALAFVLDDRLPERAGLYLVGVLVAPVLDGERLRSLLPVGCTRYVALVQRGQQRLRVQESGGQVVICPVKRVGVIARLQIHRHTFRLLNQELVLPDQLFILRDGFEVIRRVVHGKLGLQR